MINSQNTTQQSMLQGASMGAFFGPAGAVAGFAAGGLMGGGVESWFAFIIALIFLLFRPQGIFGDKIIERV